jgi:hypothetical protein
MTLVLTELTEAGLAMAADSAISRLDPQGNIKEVDENRWQKLLRVPRIKAAVSYWGTIGAVTNERFDLWLNRIISQGVYSDLSSFADYLARALNSACQDKPLYEDCPVGMHVAGFAPWPDGSRRPTLYHVHNGHLGYHEWPEYENIGENQRLVKINVWPSSVPRKLFEKHADTSRSWVSRSRKTSFRSLKGILSVMARFIFTT